MKLTTFLFLSLFLSVGQLQAQGATDPAAPSRSDQSAVVAVEEPITRAVSSADSDYALIEQTLNYYLHGGTNNNFDMLSRAFHETATMKYIRNGEYVEVNALEFFRNGMDPNRPPSDRKTRIASINIAGNAASARVEAEYATFTFVDYMNLLKIDGEWKVVSKIFFRQE